MVYYSFVCLLKLILYNSKPQNQMYDWNQKCFCFICKKLFYMAHTFDFEVSLHSWLIWPTVRRSLCRSRTTTWLCCALALKTKRGQISNSGWPLRYVDQSQCRLKLQGCPSLSSTEKSSRPKWVMKKWHKAQVTPRVQRKFQQQHHWTATPRLSLASKACEGLSEI